MTTGTTIDRRALSWLAADAGDDFVPDFVRYADVVDHEGRWISSARESAIPLSIPKSALFSRNAVWLPPTFRLRYLAETLNLLEPLGTIQHRACYSYAYNPKVFPPFPRPFRNWQRFLINYRTRLIETHGWAVHADIASYFEQLEFGRLSEHLVSLVASTDRNIVRKSLGDIATMLRGTSTVRGLPPNNEASSFFGSVYLVDVDREVASTQDLEYTRYQDDIRVIAPTREVAVRANQRIQGLLSGRGLLLNTSKTRLLAPVSDGWNLEVDGRFEAWMANIDELLDANQLLEIPVREMTDRLEAALDRGQRSELRAIGARLLAIRDQLTVTNALDSALIRVGLRGFSELPELSEFWFRLMQPVMSREVSLDVLTCLHSRDGSQGQWSNFWLLCLLAASPEGGGAVSAFARARLNSTTDPLVLSALVVLVARHGDSATQSDLVALAGRPKLHIAVARALVFASSLLRPSLAKTIRRKVDDRSSPLRSLIERLEHVGPKSWIYGWRPQIAVGESVLATAVISGRARRFRAAWSTADYE